MIKPSSKITLAAMVACAALGLGATQASAATCIGSCGASGSNGNVHAPPGGASYGWISTFGGVDGAGQIASVGGTNGSSFTTSTFSATTGQNLQYYFNYISSDGQALPGEFIYEDYASVQLVNLDTGATTMLFDARSEPTGLTTPGQGLPPIAPGVTLSPATSVMKPGSGPTGGPVWSPLGSPAAGGFSGACWGPGCGVSGWIQSNYTVSRSGNYQLVFGVTNWGDTVYDSGLAYSGIKIGSTEIEDSVGGHGGGVGAVPEPGVWALMMAGLFGVGVALRHTRRGRMITA